MEQERWRQTQELFHAALEHEASQRPAYLARACVGDDGLRQEVEGLLDGHERAEGIPDSITPALVATLIGEADEMTAESEREDPYGTAPLGERDYLGQKIGDGNRYLIEREIGRGGIGIVYLASDLRFNPDPKPVAVKMLRSEAAQDLRLRQKFEKEIKAVARLNHPNIVKGLDTGYLPDGACYLVMEFIEGKTLREALEKEPQGLDLQRVARIMRDLGRALSAAHNKGVVHRDLKPENVMLQDLGVGGEHTELLDFGIATVKDPNILSPQRSTRVIGTPPYMAPEQMLGKPEAVSDIWSLGVMAYELVTGRLPFDGENTIELYRQQEVGVQPDKLPQKLRHDLPETAQRAILKSLEFNKKARYQQVQDFTEYLVRALTDITPPPSPPNPPQPKWPLAVLLSALVVLIALVAANWYRFSKTPELPDVVEVSVEQRDTLPAHGVVLELALSPDGQRIVAADVGNVIHLRQFSDGRDLSLTGLVEQARCVAISPNGQMVAAGSNDGAIGLWRVSDGGLINVLRGHQTWVFSVGFSRDSQTLVSASADGAVNLWGVNGDSKKTSAMKRTDKEWIVAIHPDGLNLVAVSDSNGNQETVLRSVADHGLQRVLKGSKFKVSCGAFSSDGQLLALGGEDGGILVYRVSDGDLVKSLNGANGAVRSVVFGPGGQMIASGHEDGTIRLWRESDGNLLKERNGHLGKVWSLAFSADGQRLASGGEDKTIQLWQIKEKTQ